MCMVVTTTTTTTIIITIMIQVFAFEDTTLCDIKPCVLTHL